MVLALDIPFGGNNYNAIIGQVYMAQKDCGSATRREGEVVPHVHELVHVWDLHGWMGE